MLPIASLPDVMQGQPPTPRRVNPEFPRVHVYEVEQDALVVVGEQ